MNILITCPTNKVELVDLMTNKFRAVGGKVIATANSPLVQGLYTADKSYIIPSVTDPTYIDTILDICKKDNVLALIAWMEPDIMVLSKHIDLFNKNGILPFVASNDVAEICNDKYKMYQFLNKHGFKCAKTFNNKEMFRGSLEKGEISFPVFVKPRIGNGSKGAFKVKNMEELNAAMVLNKDLIIQEFLDGPEYDIDVYADVYSHEMISIFAKHKLANSIGGTVIGSSYKDEKLFKSIEKLISCLRLTGPLDVEAFLINGEYYISEVNPRFSGCYIFADACGMDFCGLIINNMLKKNNIPNIGNYEENILMLKYYKNLYIKPDSILPEKYNFNKKEGE